MVDNDGGLVMVDLWLIVIITGNNRDNDGLMVV